MRVTEKQKASHREANKRYREKNIEKVRESLRNDYLANRDERRKQQKLYHKKNIKNIMKRKDKYYVDNREKAKEYSRNRNKKLTTRLSAVMLRAKRKSLEFNLDMEWLINIPLVYAYTGEPLTLETHQQNTVSFDRVDSSRGYTKDNVVLCAYRINQMKSDLSVYDMYSWFQKAVNFKLKEAGEKLN